MSKKVSIFGVRGAGKTCFIYAMAQVMQSGATHNGTRISIISNDIQKQQLLNNGYASLVRGMWPKGSGEQTEYDFKVRLQHGDEYHEVIPSLIVNDYVGGILQGTSPTPNAFEDLLQTFADSNSLIFLIDGETLIQALDTEDVAPEHRQPADNNVILAARNEISYIENLFIEYKKRNKSIPPVLIAITKSDIFLTDEELVCGKRLIKNYLPSIFSRGSGVDSAITSISLGKNLSKGVNNELYGQLILNTTGNLHIPIVFALYAYLDSVFDGSPSEEQQFMDSVMYTLRRMFEGRIEIYSSGKRCFEIQQ